MATVEINGVKLDVDERTAITRKIESYKIGDRVKVLMKTYSSYEVKQGVIVGFDAFAQKPTINILVVANDYSGSGLQLVAFNEGAELELLPLDNEFDLLFSFERMATALENRVQEAAFSYDKAKQIKAQFEKHFGHVMAIPVDA